MLNSRDQLIFILRTLEPYWSLAHGLGVFVQSKYADDKIMYKLSKFIQDAVATIKSASLSEKIHSITNLQQQAELKKQQDLDTAENLLSGLSALGQETLEQNQIDSNADKIVDPNELRNLTPDLTNKERKKLAQSLSDSPEVQSTMLESCNKIYADISAKIIAGHALTKEDIELFQLSVYILGKNTNIVIDGVITPGKLTEQLIKEINPEYFRVRLLIDWFGPECKIGIARLWTNIPQEQKTVIFDKIQYYRTTLLDVNANAQYVQQTLYTIFVQGINSRATFNDKVWFDNLDDRIRKAQLQQEENRKQREQYKAFQEKRKTIGVLEKDIGGLRAELSQTDKDITQKQKEYEGVYKQFAAVLQENNTVREKAKAFSPYALVAAAGPVGPLIAMLRTKQNLSTNEMQQLILYEKLSAKYAEIQALQNKSKQIQIRIQEKTKQEQCLYYEMVRDAGDQKAAQMMLINLINEYGESVQKKYSVDIKVYMQGADEATQALLVADKSRLRNIMQRKNKTIDIAQQCLSGSKPQWGKMDVAGLQHLSQTDIYTIIGNEGIQQANMIGGSVAVIDNTANVRIIQTQEVVVDKGNRMGVKKGYETVGGTTSTYANILYAQYQIAASHFKVLNVPGMGPINVKIDPSLYDQIISFSEKGKQLAFVPVYDSKLQCFTLTSADVFITWIDKKGTIAYQQWPGIGESVSYIAKQEYDSLLQVKQGLTNLVAKQGPIMEVLGYQNQLQQAAMPIQQLAQLYSQTPGDQPLSSAIIGDLTGPNGLKNQLVKLKQLLSKNTSYQTIIAELRQDRSGVYDHYEKQLYDTQQMLQSLPGFVEQIDGLLNYSVWENADARTLKEFAITVAAVIGGVLLAVATSGAATGISAMVVSAAAGSLGGMAASRLAQDAFASMADTGGLTNDLHSDVGKCMLGQAQRKDVLPNVAMEFAQGTATTLMFMGAGRIIGKQLEKYVTANAGVVSREAKFAYRVRKSISKLNDSEIQLLDAKGFNRFLAKLPSELKEEFAQEGVQQTGDKGGNAVGSALDKAFGFGSGLGSSIGTLISVVTSITGKAQYRAGKMDVFIEGSDPATNTTTVSYKGDTGEFQAAIAENVATSGYVFDQEKSMNGALVYTKSTGDKTQILQFIPTQESTTIKEIDLPKHGYIYGIAFDENQTKTNSDGNYHYTYNDLTVGNNNLTTYLARNGMIIEGGIAEDGSFTALAKNGERIVFNRKPVEQSQSDPNQPTTVVLTDTDEAEQGMNVDAVSDAQQETADAQQLNESITELEKEFDTPVQDEKRIQGSFNRIVQSLRTQFQNVKGFVESAQKNPLIVLHANIVRLYEIISKRSPEMLARSLSAESLRELSYMLSGFIMEYGLVLGPLVGILAVATSLNTKLQVITQMRLQQHMQEKLNKSENVLLPTDKYGKPVYQNADGVPLTPDQAIAVYKSNLLFARTFLEGAVSGARYLIKTSFHLNSTTLLPSDVDVALNYETGKKLVEYFLNGGAIPGADGLVFEDTSKTPPQKIPLAHNRKLLAACEAGTLRIAYNTHVDGVIIEHELFVENDNETLSVFDAQGRPLDTVMVEVDGTLVPHLGEKTAIKYLSELVDRGFDQLMDGSDTKGKFFKRLRDLGDTKNTLGYLNAVSAFINNIRTRVENKIGFKKGDEYQKQITELRQPGKFKMLFDYIPANHPALTAPVQLNRDLDRDIHNLNEQCMAALRTQDMSGLGSTLVQIEKLLQMPTASVDQLVHLAALKLLIIRNGGDVLGSNQQSEHMYYRYDLPDVALEEAQAKIGDIDSPFYIPQRHYSQGGEVASRETIKTLAGPPLLGACEMAYDKNIVTYGSDYRNGSGSGYIEIRLDKLSPENRAVIEAMQGNPLYQIDFADSSEHTFGDKSGNGTPFVRVIFLTAKTTGQLQQQSLDFMNILEKQEYMADVFDLNDPNQNEQFGEILFARYLLDDPEEINKLFKDLVADRAIIVTENNKVYIYPREYERVTGQKLSEYNPNPDRHYFPNRQSRLQFSENDARENAKLMDDVAGEPTNETLRNKAKQDILDTLKAKGIKLPEGFVVDDPFLDAIIKAHEITGGEGEGLGNFSLSTLLAKRRALDAYLKTRIDLTAEQQSAITRCLMEGGFCGKNISVNQTSEIGNFSLNDRQNITDKQSLESFLDRAFESYKSTAEYQLFAQIGMTKLVDQILMLRKNRLLTRYGDSQGSIDYFKVMQEMDLKSALFDVGFVSFQERITDLESRLQLSPEDIATIVTNYFPQETLDIASDDSYDLSMLSDLLIKVQNIGIVKKEGLITAENERIVQSLANSGMFDVYFLDSYDLKELLSENTTEQLQAKLDQRIAYREEVLAIADDLGFDMTKYSITPGKFSLTYLRNLQKLKPIVYGDMRYLSLGVDAQNIINNLSDFDVQFAITYKMDLMRLFAYVRTAKEKTTLFKSDDLPGLERLFEQYKLSKRYPNSYTLEQWLGSSDFNDYVLLYKAFGSSFESEWRNHYDKFSKVLSVKQYLTLFASFENSADSPGYLHFMANYEKCGGAKKYLLLYERLGGIANVDGRNRRGEFSALETNVLSKTPKEFLLLYESFGNDKSKYEQYYSLVDRIAQSPSGELQLIGGEVAKQLVGRENPMAILNQIIEIFEKNNLPEIGKQFKVFQILHSPQYLEQKIKGGEVFDPQLLELYGRIDINTAQKYQLAMDLFYADLLRIHIESNNHQLKSYVEFMMEGEGLLSRYELGQELSAQERRQLVSRLQKLNTLYVSSSTIRSRSSGVDNQSISEENINDTIAQLRKQIGVGPGETIGGKLVDIFVRPVGYSSFTELSTHMDSQQEQYHKRGEELYRSAKLDAQGNRVLVLHEGDLINGFGGEGVPNYMERILQIGPAAKEFLGYGGSKSGDRTKLDADFIRVTSASQNDFNRFTAHGDVHGVFEANPDSVFETKMQGDDHVGIRTGLESGKLKFIRVQESVINNPTQLSQLFACIAINGWYIPVCDPTGKIIFSPSDYQVYRDAFAGTKNGDQSILLSDKVMPQSLQDATAKLQQDMAIDQESIAQKNRQLSSGIAAVLAKYNIQTKQDDYDGDLSKALVLNTGSTGRGTNAPGDFDFDLAIGLTDSQIRDYGDQIQNDLAVFLGGQAAAGNKPGQIRITNSPEFGDVDILITRRNQFTEYYTHNAIEERLELIKKEQGEEKYNAVRANIVLAKKLFKEAGVYKKTEGGMTGAGVENWILSHGGDIYAAALSFLEIAKLYPDFQEFALHYLIVDPGVDLRSASRDNFLLLGNASQQSFEEMKAVCERIVAGDMGVAMNVNSPTPPNNPTGGLDGGLHSDSVSYFNGDKRNHFEFTTEQATTHSDDMNTLEKDPTNKTLRNKAKQDILDTLKAKGIKLPEGFVVDDPFLDAIIKAHEITGGEGEGLGNFSLSTLLAKRRALDAYLKTRIDLTAEQQSAITRCLMEGGFCGKGIASVLYYMIKGRSEYKDPNAHLPFEQRRAIAQQQLEQNGITDEQRSAYMPGLSEELYETISPVNYNVGEKISQFMGYKEKYHSSDDRSDAWALYLGLPQTHDTFDISEYVPAKSEKKDVVYFHLKGRDVELFDRFKHRLVTYDRLERAIATNDNSPYGKLLQEEYSGQYYHYKSTGKMSQNGNEVMGNFTMSTGVDPENGLHYVSYYDIWDLHPFAGPLKWLGDRLPGKPFEIYGRIYYDPQTMQVIDPKAFSVANDAKDNTRDDVVHNDEQKHVESDSKGMDTNNQTIDHQRKNGAGDNLIINHMLVKDRSSYDFEVINDLPQISNGLIQNDDPVAEMHILPLTKGMSAREYLSQSIQGLAKYQEYLKANIGKEGFPKYIVGVSHLALMTKRFGFNVVDLNQDQIFKTRAYKTILNPENYGVRKEMWLQFKAFFSTQAATEYKDYQMYKKMFERFEPTDVRLSYISTEEFLNVDFSQRLPK